jgi:hypothetical protein
MIYTMILGREREKAHIFSLTVITNNNENKIKQSKRVHYYPRVLPTKKPTKM